MQDKRKIPAKMVQQVAMLMTCPNKTLAVEQDASTNFELIKNGLN